MSYSQCTANSTAVTARAPQKPSAHGEVRSGTGSASRGDDADIEQFTQIAEITIDQGGERVFLYTDKAVQNVHIDVGNWDPAGTVFTPEYSAFAACSLTPGDAVMVEASIPDTAPNLRLTYLSNGETVICYLSQGGEDGYVLLLNE